MTLSRKVKERSSINISINLFNYFAEEELLRTTSRRKRYPAKGAKILQSVCSTNRNSLKDLKVNSLGKRKLSEELSEKKENDLTDETEVELYESAAKRLKTWHHKVKANMDKSKRIEDANKIMKNAENALASI